MENDGLACGLQYTLSLGDSRNTVANKRATRMNASTPSLPWAQDDDYADDALLVDLITFLDAEPLSPGSRGGSPAPASPDTSNGDASPSLPRSPRSLPKPKRKRSKPSFPITRKLDVLREEADQLTNTLSLLRDQAAQTMSRHAVEALTERQKRCRAEQEREQLRGAVHVQAQFLKGLRSVFSSPPSYASGLNLCRHLHNYTRLPRDRAVRRSEYAVLSEESRLQRAMEILCRETQSLASNERDDWDSSTRLLSSTVREPVVETEVITEQNGFGITSTSVYALETRDLSVVARGACLAVRDVLTRCSSYKCVNLKGQIVDPAATSTSATNLLYRVAGVHHKSPREDKDELSVESRLVTLYKQTEDYAVVLWDFIDEDALHPITDADVTRQAIGACLIRREICDDGVERTVCRILGTRRYLFHADAAPDKLRRFQKLLSIGCSENDLSFRHLVLDSVAKEEAAYARVVGGMPMAACPT